MTLLNSPGWAGAYSWLDCKNNACGLFLAWCNADKML